MKKMKILVALGLAVCMIAGCGSTVTQKESSVQESSQTKKTTGNSETSTQQQEVNNYPDYLNMDSLRPIVKEGEEITLKVAVQRESNANSDINSNWFVKFIEEKLNINLEIEEITSDERKNLMFVSDELPDMLISVGLTNQEVVQYGVEGGQLLPISDYFSEELTPNILRHLTFNEAAVNAATTPDGKIYALPTLAMSSPGYGDTIGTYRMFIDKAYMKAAGIEEVPTTLDGFVDMLRKFKEVDPKAMGVNEFWPLVNRGSNEIKYLQNAFGWINTSICQVTNPVWDTQTQSVEVPCLTDKFADYVKLFHTLYSEGLLHPDYYTLDSTAQRALYAEGKSAINADAAPYVAQPERFTEFISCAPLTSEWSKTPVATKSDAFTLGRIFVSADTKYPEVCLRLIDYLCSDEGSVYSTKGCPAGSEDTMGIIEGFYLGEDGTIVFGDVASGAAESGNDYQVNFIKIGQMTLMNESLTDRVMYEMLGVEKQNAELDITDPDAHYRYLCYEAQNEYLVQALPSLYMNAEQTQKFTDLQTVLKSYADQEMAKFVTGQRPIEEVDKLVGELKAAGGEEYLKMVKELYKDYEMK